MALDEFDDIDTEDMSVGDCGYFFEIDDNNGSQLHLKFFIKSGEMSLIEYDFHLDYPKIELIKEMIKIAERPSKRAKIDAEAILNKICIR